MCSQVISEDYIAFNIKDEKGFPIGTSEASYLPDNNCFYFNRLFVSPKYRKCGYGAKLLESLLRYMDYIGKDLLLDINPYGDLDYKQLEQFYMKHGFVKLDDRYIYKYNSRREK